jgi:hypothetical protein
MGKRVKIIEDVPKQDLDGMIAVHKNDGAQVGYKEQSNGKYRIEAVFENAEEPAPQLETITSSVSGDKLTPG